MNENTFADSFFYCFDLCLLVFFFCLHYSKPFQNNQMHCEVTDRYFNVFFVEIQLKKEKLESAFWAPEFGYPNVRKSSV